MIIGVTKETYPGECRVALAPSSVGKLTKAGHEIQVESSAGVAAGYADADYESAGATIAPSRTALFEKADIVLQVRGAAANPDHFAADLQSARSGQMLVGSHDPLWDPEPLRQLSEKGVTTLSLEMIPRISRAQSMDVLSSMATIAGYKAVLVAASELPKMFPMLMTAAGTVTAARVFVLGAGVAGLQAISAARRLGAVVEGYDIRPAAAEQIRSLGAKSIELELETAESEDAGGYAKEQAEDFNRRQQELLTEVVGHADVVITTAAIPGARSPVLITKAMVDGMQAGSVIVDLAAERGGNCELTQADQVIESGGVKILGPTDLPSSVARDASQMHSNNVTTLLLHLTGDEGKIELDFSDEITDGTTTAHGGEVRHPRVREKLGLQPLPTPEPATTE